MHMLRTLTTAASLLSLTALAVPSALAGPINYTFSGLVSGTLNGQSFTDATITFTAPGDTANVNTAIFGPGTPTNEVGSPTFSLSGFGSGSLTDPFAVFDNQGFAAAGLFDATLHLDLYDLDAPEFATYDLTTSLGPVLGDALGNRGVVFGTSLGDLEIESFGRGSFAASTNPVPEASTPASFGLLLALGMGGVVIAARKKKAGARA